MWFSLHINLVILLYVFPHIPSKFAVHGWSEKSQKWFKFYLRTERRASTIASGRTVKQSLSQENVLRSSVHRRYEQCNCIREHILEDYLYVSRINHFKHRLLPALLSNIAGRSAIITHVDAYSLSCCLWLLLLRDTRLQTSETLDSLIGMLHCRHLMLWTYCDQKWFHDMSFATLVWICASCAILCIALPTHNLSTLSLLRGMMLRHDLRTKPFFTIEILSLRW